MKTKIPTDDRLYTVVGVNGYRMANQTWKEACRIARRMAEEMRLAGWRGEMRVYYRDGTLCRGWDRDDTEGGIR